MMPQEFEDALAELLSGDRNRQAAAHGVLMELAERPELKEAIGLRMMTLAAEDDPMVRGTAFLVLAVAQGKECLPRLERHLQDPEPEVRCDLAHAAAIIGQPARELLLTLVRDPVLEVRFEAASGLAERDDPSGREALVEALGRAPLRYQALAALQRIADEGTREPVARVFHKFFVSAFERCAAAGVLARLGDPEARRWLVERIRKRRGDDRGLAIELCAGLKLSEAVEALLEVLERQEEPFRGAAARALGAMGEERVIERLGKLLLDEKEEPELRMDVAEGLDLGGTEAGRRLLQQALGTAQDPEVVTVVRALLEETPAQEGEPT